MKKLLILTLMIISIFGVTACGRDRDESEKPVVMATLFPHYDFARQIAGDYIDLEFIVPPGVSPHAYEPGPGRAIQLLEADLLLYTGDIMEPWVPRLINPELGSSNLRVLDLSQNIHNIPLGDHHDHDHDHDHDEEAEIDTFEILNRRDNQSVTAYVHGNHWHGSLPAVEVGSSLSLGANIVSIDGRQRELDSDGSHNGLTVEIYGTDEGIIEVAQHGDHVHIIGVSEGVAQVVFNWTHSGEVRYTTPPMNVTVGESDDYEHRLTDPHYWVDPINAQIMVLDILEALVELLPEHEDELRENANSLLAQLASLHLDFISMRANVDLSMIMHGGHNAFGHLFHRYNIEYVVPYRGFSDNAEPSTSQIIEMVERMDQYGIEHLFIEFTVSERVANTIADETNATVLYLYSTENAPIDKLNEGITFIDMMRHNLEQFKIGLQYNGS